MIFPADLKNHGLQLILCFGYAVGPTLPENTTILEKDMPGQQGTSIAYQAEIDAGFDRLIELTLLRVEGAGCITKMDGDNVACVWMTADAESISRQLGKNLVVETALPASERDYQLMRQASGC